MLLAAAEIAGDTGIAIGVVVTIVIAAVAYGADRSSTRHRLEALESAQEKDNKWQSEQFTPWRRKVDLFMELVKSRLPDRDAAQSRSSWPKTDDH